VGVMVVKALVSVEEYLKASFPSPEPDFVEGELVERAVPNTFHSKTQVRLSDAFLPWQRKGLLFRAVEIRLRLRENQFRVADFALFAADPAEAIPEELPRAVVEVLSPDDRYEDLMDRMSDYQEAGVEFLFLADPAKRKLSRYFHGDLLSVRALEMPSFGVGIPLDEIFPS
jgi:Uma2 family endonuclease